VDRAAAKALFKALDKDSQYGVRKHAALALSEYAGKGEKLVRKRLERAAGKEEEPSVQCALVYALVKLGPKKSTVRIVRKVLDQQRQDWSRSFIESALQKLEGGKGRFSGSWLFMDDREDPARKE
jgi:HEAT repeat protein